MRPTIAVIQCEAGGEWERLLAECDGTTLLEVMAARLKQVPNVASLYLYLEDEARRRPLRREAARLGIRCLYRGPGAFGAWLRLAWECLGAAAVVRVREDCPLVDPDVTGRVVGRLTTETLDCAYAVDFPPGIAPSQVISPRFVLKTALRNLGTVLARPRLVTELRQALKRGRTAYLRMSELCGRTTIPQSFLVTTPTDLTTLVELYGGLDLRRFTIRALAELYGDEERFIDFLVAQRERSQSPHLINAVLNRYEAERGRAELKSYPVSVGFNIMPICNVDCAFCSFSPQEMVNRNRVTLEEFQQLTWLKYVSELALWGGVGESLINPEFPRIFSYALEKFPHLKIGLSTIGKALTPEISDLLLDRLNFLNVSLNAATSETHAKVVKAGRFDRVVSNVRYLMEQRRARGLTRPRVHLSMVIMRENVEEMPAFAELAADLGVESAVFSHYLTTTIEGHRKSPEESSLYHHQDLTDEMIRKTQQRADELGLNVFLPPLFSNKSCGILFSCRSEFGPSGDCYEPWRNCYLSVDEQGRRQLLFCCSGMYLRTFYDVRKLDDAHFKQLWNGPVPQHFRRTTNSKEGNPLCSFCKTEDRFDPQNKKIYEIDRAFGGYLEQLAGGGTVLVQLEGASKS